MTNAIHRIAVFCILATTSTLNAFPMFKPEALHDGTWNCSEVHEYQLTPADAFRQPAVRFVQIQQPKGPATVPTSYRVIVLDVSGSMNAVDDSGGQARQRIQIAIEEIRQLARQLPPSPANPIGLALFNDVVQTHEFTNLPRLEAFLDAIQASGGTAISLGLQGAHTLLQPARQSAAMFVLLYTDGENGEPDGDSKVATQEAALDRLFATRNDHGLATHVICRRWADANNDWINTLKQKPHWGVIDAEDFALQSITAATVLEVASARWLNNQSLEVTLRGHARVSGTKGAIDRLEIRCINGVVAGNGSVALPSDEKQPTTFLVTMQSANLGLKDGRGQLHFQVQTLAPRVVGRNVIWPAVDPRVTVPFEVPPKERTLALHGELKPLASRWTDPGRRQVTVDVELSLDVRAVKDNPSPWPSTIDFLIEPAKGVFLVSGSPVLRVAGDGRATTRIALARELPVGLAEGELAVQLVPQNAPSYFVLQPQLVVARATFPRPNPANTELIAKAGPPVHGHWTDVGRELAVFEFPVSVVVRGPTTDSSFTIVAPPNVFDIDFEPSKLRSGEQTILVRLEARCDATVPATIRLDIVPPPATDVVQYTVAQPLNVQIIGPPPVQLVLTNGKQFADGLRIEIPDTMDTYEDALTTALLGAPDGIAASGIQTQLKSIANLPFTISSTSRIGEPLPFTFRVPPDHKQNFWQDSRYEVELAVEPDRPVQSIVGSKAVLQLVIPAPFKRWFFGVLVVVGVTVLVVGPFFALRRVHRDDDCEASNAVQPSYRNSGPVVPSS